MRYLLLTALLLAAAPALAIQPGATGSITLRNGAVDVNEADNFAWSGAHNFTSATLRVPNSSTAMSTCTVGDIKQDTDASAGERLRLCIATDTSVGIDNAFGTEIDATEMAASLAFSGQELDLNTNSGNSLRLPITGTNPATAGGLVIDSTAPYELEWYAGSGLRGLVNYALLAGRASGGQALYGGDGSAANQWLALYGANRADGSDDAALTFNGGGAGTTGRGGQISLTGNEAFSNLAGGQVLIYAGNDSTGLIKLSTGAEVQRVLVENDGDVCVGAETSCTARLDITEATIGNEAFAIRSNATNDDPNLRFWHGRATAAASSTTNIDFNLTTAACPASNVCTVDVTTTCHCTSGSSCTGHDGGANRSMLTVKNNGGTISLLGSVVTPMATQIGASSLTSITASVSSPNVRVAVVVPANFNHTCHVVYQTTNVGS